MVRVCVGCCHLMKWCSFRLTVVCVCVSGAFVCFCRVAGGLGLAGGLGFAWFLGVPKYGTPPRKSSVFGAGSAHS